MRYRITFSKTSAMRFTGHLDLHRTLERTMRRANLPLAYSQGFTPRPKLTLASALPLGYTSESEIADFWLKEEMGLPQIDEAFKASQPPGVELHQVQNISSDAPKLQTTLTMAKFNITLLDEIPNLDQKIADLLNRETILREKIKKGKKKISDIRPLIFEVLNTTPQDTEQQRLAMTLKAEPSATGRPDHVLEAMGIDPLSALIHRTELIFT
ncbi:MAG: TIGR03936 family radical SAM-associated protein [Chloroflexota bacterium]